MSMIGVNTSIIIVNAGTIVDALINTTTIKATTKIIIGNTSIDSHGACTHRHSRGWSVKSTGPGGVGQSNTKMHIKLWGVKVVALGS